MPALERPFRAAGILGALSFLTVVPVGRGTAPGASDVGRGAVYFPLVGAFVGGAVALSAWAASLILPLTLAALIGVGAGAVLTGALHLDGLADTADGYGGRTRARALEIMRDHSVGSYGVVAVVLDLGLRTAALASLLPSPHRLLYLVAAGALSRSLAVGLGALLPDARGGRGQASLLEGVGAGLAAVAAAAGIVIAVLLTRWPGLLAALGVAALGVLWGLHCRRRLGGMTGDTLGAASEASEVFVLLVGVALR
jgi:cobalamin 5'-phosphate synthase/cobalamin synthase